MTSVATGMVMRVTKRNGSMEPVDLDKIIRSIKRAAEGMQRVDVMRVAQATIASLYDGATTEELDQVSISTAAGLVAEEPEYSKLAAALLMQVIDKEVERQGVLSFSQSVRLGHSLKRFNERLLMVVDKIGHKLDRAIVKERDRNFEYFGLKTMYDRYLTRHPKTRKVIETPQHFFMRIAAALTESRQETLDLYDAYSKFEYLSSSPTLFNAGGIHEQLASCFLLDSPLDSLDSIYDRFKDVALLSKYAGGIGVAYHRIRSRGSLIRGTNGPSQGIGPLLQVFNASVGAVSQGGKRKGAACVYLESWHGDIEEFLQQRDNTGDPSQRTHNLNLANWIPDLFMKRVQEDGVWTLFDPDKTPQLPDLYGEAFELEYTRLEKEGKFVKQMPARELYQRMLRTLAETGNGWMTFKDRCNELCSQTGPSGETVHLSNLCTEIVEVQKYTETAVCNIGSINLANHIKPEGGFDWQKLAHTVEVAVKQLNRTVDLTAYNIDSARASNDVWRPIGLGLMGLQDVFFKLRIAFDEGRAKNLSTMISERVYYHAVKTSIEIAKAKGHYSKYPVSRTAVENRFHFEFECSKRRPETNWSISEEQWDALRKEMAEHGMRNSLLIAIAPTATIASILGCYECIEPQTSNMFKRQTLSGDFFQINGYLVEELRKLGLWTHEMREAIKAADGSIQGIAAIPAEIRSIYRTVWEHSMKTLIDMAAARGKYVDQSQSLNLFIESPTIDQLSSMYAYAWESGLKTTYYLRSRAASRVASINFSNTEMKVTVKPAGVISLDKTAKTAEQIACSLENPESCEACQ